MQGHLRRPPAGWRRAEGLSASPLRRPYLLVTLGVLSLVTMIAFEAMAISTAMPVVAQDLGALREYGFVFSAFLTPYLLGGVVAGSWTDRRGPAAPMRLGLVLFGVGLLICGLAGSLGVLLLGRAVAGGGAGLLGVCIYVVIGAVFPQSLQPRVFSLLSAAWVVPGLVGPALAGFLAEQVSWRAVFLLVPPLIVPPALALLPHVHGISVTAATDEEIAGGGAMPSIASRMTAGLGLCLGVGALQWGLGNLNQPGRVPLAAALAGVGLLGVLLTFPRLAPAGTLRLGRGLPTVIALRGLYAGAFFAVESFVPLMLVTQRGLSPTQAGLALSGGAIGWTVGSYVQSRPNLRLPRHRLLMIGGLVVGLSEWAMIATIRPGLPVPLAPLCWAGAAFGMGLGMASVSVLMLRLTPAYEQGRNSAALQLSDALGSALGIGLSGAAFAAWHVAPGQDATLFSWIWLAAGAVAVFAGVIAYRARTLDPKTVGP